MFSYLILTNLQQLNSHVTAVRLFIGVNFTSMDRDKCTCIFSFLFYCFLIRVLIPNFCGFDSPSQVLTLQCAGLVFETRSGLPFDFTNGACSTNDNHIMLCFSKQNYKRCYKSRSPTPEQWWQFTLTRMSNYEHKSTAISLSSGLWYTQI